MLPWLMERREVPLAEVAATFRMSAGEVESELELAAMCGVPPFVDELIDVFIDDETVFVGVPRLFTKPLRLTAPEGFALVTAGRAAMQLPGADPASALGRGLAKLAAVLGEDIDDSALVVDLATTPMVEEFVAATKRVERLRIRYWTASRDETTERELTPRRVFHERGEWYVAGDDHRSGEYRTFRIDRVESVERTGTFDDAPDAHSPPDSRSPGRQMARSRESPFASGQRHGGSSRSTRSTRRRTLVTGRSRRVLRLSASAGWSGCCCAPEPTPRSSSRRRGGISVAASQRGC
jgi:proteasome accessory factor C